MDAVSEPVNTILDQVSNSNECLENTDPRRKTSDTATEPKMQTLAGQESREWPQTIGAPVNSKVVP